MENNKSFIANYLTYCEGNEAPALYHSLCCYSILASLVGRRVWIEQGIFTFYPNLYVVLVGSPGGGKSTALDIAKGFIRSIKNIPIAADATTVQALLRGMSEEVEGKENSCRKNFKYNGQIIEYTPMAIFAGELVSFMAMDPYGWIIFLTTVYHEDVHEVKTKNKGDDLIPGPFMNMLGCLTPDTTTDMLGQKIISSGFSRRTIYVWAAGRSGIIPWPTITDEQKACIHACKAWALQLQKITPGPMTWEPEAKKWYEEFYTKLRKDQDAGKLGTALTSSYYESKHVQLMKLASLTSLSESLDKVITLDHIQTALMVLEATEDGREKVFEGTGKNQNASVAAKILELVLRIPRLVSEKEIMRAMYHDAKREDIAGILHHLHATDRIIRFNRELNGQDQGIWVCSPEVYKEYQQKLGVKIN